MRESNNVSIWSPPLSMTKVFDFLNKKFLCRLSVLYVYGMNYILNMCWKVIKSVGLVDEGTSKKFNFISGQNDINNYVLKHINPSQLENRFGVPILGSVPIYNENKSKSKKKKGGKN